MSDVRFGLSQDFFGTSPGTVSASDSNFGATPKAVLHAMVRATALNTRTSDDLMSLGAATSQTTDETFAFTVRNANATATVDTVVKQINTEVAYFPNLATGSRDGWHRLGATPFASNQVNFDVNNTYGSAWGTMTLMLGGADLDVVVGTFETDNVTAGTTTVVTPSIDMTNAALIIWGMDDGWNTAQAATEGNHKRVMGMGSYDGTTFRQASASQVDDIYATTSDPRFRIDDSHIYRVINSDTGAAEYALEWTAASSTTFTVTVRDATAGSSADFGYMAIALPSDWNAHVSVQDTPTSTGNEAYSPTGASGWTPSVLLQILTLMESVDTSAANSQAGGFGLRAVIGTGSDDEYCVSNNVESGSADTDTDCGIHDSGFMNEDDGTSGYEMDLSSFDSDGWTDNYASVMGTAKKTICLIMGENDAAPTGKAKTLPLLGVG